MPNPKQLPLWPDDSDDSPEWHPSDDSADNDQQENRPWYLEISVSDKDGKGPRTFVSASADKYE